MRHGVIRVRNRMVPIGMERKKLWDLITNCIWKWVTNMKIQKLGSGDFWKNGKLRNESWVSEEANDVSSINCHQACKDYKEEFQVTWKAEVYFKDCLHTFAKSGPSAREAEVKLFMQIIFSAGSLRFFRGDGVRPDCISNAVRATAPLGKYLHSSRGTA